MKSILVTGSTGFIGQHTLSVLRKYGYDVHISVRTRLKIHSLKPEISSQVSIHYCDLFDYNQQVELFESIKPSHLLHFAWDATPGKFWTSENNLQWLECSMQLLRNFAKHHGERAVFAGTCAEYDWSYGYCTENLTPTNPSTLYGVCKNSLRQVSEQFCKDREISFAWGRIFWLYGVNEASGRLVSSVIQNLTAKQVAKCSHGNQVRDFMYVEDVARAFVELLNSDVAGNINIASGKAIAIKDIVTEIGKQMGLPELIGLGMIEASKDEHSFILANTSILNNKIGFRPQYSLEEGIRKTIQQISA
ncbi:NAD-dependent epimerase/dehydratase [[Leptolyngbya] sp. PCC 7376]|uniref:NAD-dependent epimerase/dehydratase family protein n=1 Tax=[Leptolyngbya] sp. PCC 7376 TaxID=111781 RepID=UPI00029F1A9E|nr:NAD(P)-dependent oxidoreductase [[Leptolyngbya] sp. PCC 7376]AFY36958.1 NAD-dependent epimerase/dehydratase [[Leptolyngbya] sp. PCC 7376]